MSSTISGGTGTSRGSTENPSGGGPGGNPTPSTNPIFLGNAENYNQPVQIAEIESTKKRLLLNLI